MLWGGFIASRKGNKRRPDGYVTKQVYLGKDENGKRICRSVYGHSQKEAEEKAIELKLSCNKGVDVIANRDTFGMWAKRFINVKSTVGLSASQMRSYANYCRILAPLNDIPLTKVTAYNVQCVINDMAAENPTTGKPTGKKTLIALKGTAEQIFKLAIESRVIDFNAASMVKIPKSAPQEHRRALSPEEQKWIVDTPHRAQLPAMLMMYAGLRRGEVTALTWGDIDFDNKIIYVNKAVEMIHGKPYVKDPKTAAGNRIVNIPNILVDFLHPLKESDDKLVCKMSNGQMMTNQAWRTMWSSYLTDLNVKYGYSGNVNKFSARQKGKDGKIQGKLILRIPNITPHMLRHTFATLLYQAGIDFTVARDQLGHSDIKTTLSIYTHLDKIHEKASMNKLNNFLESQEEEQK